MSSRGFKVRENSPIQLYFMRSTLNTKKVSNPIIPNTQKPSHQLTVLFLQ